MNTKIIFENSDFLVLNKPAGVLVHPTAANEPDTLVDWFLEKYPEANKMSWPDKSRAGIVHRLDKDTSGLILLAKNPETLIKLQEKFKNHEIKKTYWALVCGSTPQKDKIEISIVRDKDKDMMKVQEATYSWTRGTVREAVTEYKTLKYYRFNEQNLSLVEVSPKTGRMHQIRVHLKYAGFPLVGDQLYQTKISNLISKELGINRQFLHAVKLEFDEFKFDSDLTDDLKKILSILK